MSKVRKNSFSGRSKELNSLLGKQSDHLLDAGADGSSSLHQHSATEQIDSVLKMKAYDHEKYDMQGKLEEKSKSLGNASKSVSRRQELQDSNYHSDSQQGGSISSAGLSMTSPGYVAGGWSCPQCTFQNPVARSRRCDMCAFVRKSTGKIPGTPSFDMDDKANGHKRARKRTGSEMPGLALESDSDMDADLDHSNRRQAACSMGQQGSFLGVNGDQYSREEEEREVTNARYAEAPRSRKGYLIVWTCCTCQLPNKLTSDKCAICVKQAPASRAPFQYMTLHSYATLLNKRDTKKQASKAATSTAIPEIKVIYSTDTAGGKAAYREVSYYSDATEEESPSRPPTSANEPGPEVDATMLEPEFSEEPIASSSAMAVKPTKKKRGRPSKAVIEEREALAKVERMRLKEENKVEKRQVEIGEDDASVSTENTISTTAVESLEQQQQQQPVAVSVKRGPGRPPNKKRRVGVPSSVQPASPATEDGQMEVDEFGMHVMVTRSSKTCHFLDEGNQHNYKCSRVGEEYQVAPEQLPIAIEQAVFVVGGVDWNKDNDMYEVLWLVPEQYQVRQIEQGSCNEDVVIITKDVSQTKDVGQSSSEDSSTVVMDISAVMPAGGATDGAANDAANGSDEVSSTTSTISFSAEVPAMINNTFEKALSIYQRFSAMLSSSAAKPSETDSVPDAQCIGIMSTMMTSDNQLDPDFEIKVQEFLRRHHTHQVSALFALFKCHYNFNLAGKMIEKYRSTIEDDGSKRTTESMEDGADIEPYDQRLLHAMDVKPLDLRLTILDDDDRLAFQKAFEIHGEQWKEIRVSLPGSAGCDCLIVLCPSGCDGQEVLRHAAAGILPQPLDP